MGVEACNWRQTCSVTKIFSLFFFFPFFLSFVCLVFPFLAKETLLASSVILAAGLVPKGLGSGKQLLSLSANSADSHKMYGCASPSHDVIQPGIWPVLDCLLSSIVCATFPL